MTPQNSIPQVAFLLAKQISKSCWQQHWVSSHPCQWEKKIHVCAQRVSYLDRYPGIVFQCRCQRAARAGCSIGMLSRGLGWWQCTDLWELGQGLHRDWVPKLCPKAECENSLSLSLTHKYIGANEHQCIWLLFKSHALLIFKRALQQRPLILGGREFRTTSRSVWHVCWFITEPAYTL